jgi:threonine dehydrogenase-like Zn-dependent dehydrogenase
MVIDSSPFSMLKDHVTGIHLENGEVSVRNSPRPKRRTGQALLRLRLAGICNTDLELMHGYYGFRGRPGHEFVADVVECDEPQWMGRRVVGEINLACGKCDWCARSLGRHCPHRTVLGIVKHPGAFAEFLTLPVENLRAVPARMPDEVAVFTEPVAAACEILEQTRIPKGDEVAVLGDGKLGLLIAQTLSAHGCRVLLFGRHRRKLRIAEQAGVTGEISSGKMPQAKFRWVVEATGSAAGLAQAVAMTVPRGTVVCKSTVHGTVAIDMAPVIVNEITLLGSRCGRFEPALRLLGSGKIQTGLMIDDQFPLASAGDAFSRAAERGVLKVLLHP